MFSPHSHWELTQCSLQLTYVYKINCKSNLRLLKNSKYVCGNLRCKFLTFNYLKCFAKTAFPKTWHCTELVGIMSGLQAALPNLNKRSALAQVSCSSQKAQSSPCYICTGQKAAWFILHRAGQEWSLSKKQTIRGQPFNVSGVQFPISTRRVLGL